MPTGSVSTSSSGAKGPPLLLVHGWPENWYAWRFLMPALARDFTVIAVDQRGIGLSEQTTTGYDSATLAADLAALMTALGHQQFAVVGHDTGLVVSYALAADYRDRVVRLAVAEVPGPPGVYADRTAAPPPPMFVPEGLNNKLWHIPFNRVNNELIVDMVASNARRTSDTSTRSRAAPPRCRTTPSTTTSACTPATGTPCGLASVSTAPGTPTWPRTGSVRRSA